MPLLRFLPEASNIDFIGARYYAFAVDGLLLLVSIISIATHGFNWADFTGGVAMEVKAAQTINIGQLRAEVGSLHFNDTEIQYFGGGACDHPVNSCASIRVQPKSGVSGQDTANAVKTRIGAAYTVRNSTYISGKVSQELFQAGVLATVLAIVGIAIWVAFRFEWQYGISAALSPRATTCW